MADPPPIPPILRDDAPLPEPRTVWTPRAERLRTDAAATRTLARIAGISLNFVYSAAGLALLGWGVDYLAGTYPLWLLIGAGLGVVAGAYRFVREASALSRGQAAARRPAPKGPAGTGTPPGRSDSPG